MREGSAGRGPRPRARVGEREEERSCVPCGTAAAVRLVWRAPICSERQCLLGGRSDRSGRWPSRVCTTRTPAARHAASTRLRGGRGRAGWRAVRAASQRCARELVGGHGGGAGGAARPLEAPRCAHLIGSMGACGGSDTGPGAAAQRKTGKFLLDPCHDVSAGLSSCVAGGELAASWSRAGRPARQRAAAAPA